ncbi:MAG: hypothetical protein FWC61_00145 [Proteobacteria bacterium]|nr:hypothetical protein [Pseudomonadota bacterium]
MNISVEVLWIFGGIGALALLGLAVALFFVSRRSQRVMESLLELLMSPERAKIADASRVVKNVMNAEVESIELSFKKMAAALEQHIMRAEALEKQLGERNKALVGTATEATKSLADQTGKLEKQLGGFEKILGSKQWKGISDAIEKFDSNVNKLLSEINNTVQDATERARALSTVIDGWCESGKILTGQLQSDMENNTSHMNSLVTESEAMQEKMAALSTAVANGFAGVRQESADYEKTMAANEKILARQLEKMDAFTKQSKTMLVSQMNGLTSTANVVGGQIRLAESSLEKQGRTLSEAVTKLMEAAETTEAFIRNISGEVAVLAGKFQGEIREFATGVVGELNTVHTVANKTLDDTKSAAGAFSESVRTMADGVKGTLAEMSNAHEVLTGQSQELIKVSTDTAESLRPLSQLIEKYYNALPDLANDSAEMTAQLQGGITALDEKLREMNTAARETLMGIADSSLKLDHLSGQSRQQMIDLLSDYAKAVDTMQTLNRQMAEARATAPMAAMASAPAASGNPAAINVMPRLTPAEFVRQSERLIEKMHELSVDLTRSVGAEIPDSIWSKYHAGDKTIFSKWFAKMLGAADRRRVRELFKSDAVFRSQATQFVRSFAKMLAGAEHTDNQEMLTATLLKTDLGQMYMVLKGFM